MDPEETTQATYYNSLYRHGVDEKRRIQIPAKWRPAKDGVEFTLVLQGLLRVQHKGGSLDVHAGQAVITNPGEWVQYSTPASGGAEYVAVCLPAFSPKTVHRDE